MRHGVDEDDLAYYARNELAAYPDDEDFESPAGRALRDLKARRAEIQWEFMEGQIEAGAAEASATREDTVEALKALEKRRSSGKGTCHRMSPLPSNGMVSDMAACRIGE